MVSQPSCHFFLLSPPWAFFFALQANLETCGQGISVTNCCTTLQLTFVPLKCMEVRVLNLSCPAVSLNRKRANMYIKKTFTLTQSNVMPKHQQLSVSCLNDVRTFTNHICRRTRTPSIMVMTFTKSIPDERKAKTKFSYNNFTKCSLLF